MFIVHVVNDKVGTYLALIAISFFIFFIDFSVPWDKLHGMNIIVVWATMHPTLNHIIGFKGTYLVLV